MTSEPFAHSKLALRRQMRQRRACLPIHEQALGAMALIRRLQSLRLAPEKGLLLGTVPVRGEIDARPFLQLWLEVGGSLALPRIDENTGELEIRTIIHLDQTIIGFRRIPEPDPDSTRVVSPRSVKILLIPGVAFDLRGNRLGQGGGHYDRLLGLLGDSALRIGIAHDFQIIPAIPRIEPHDQPMDFVVSPIRSLDLRPRRGRLAPS